MYFIVGVSTETDIGLHDRADLCLYLDIYTEIYGCIFQHSMNNVKNANLFGELRWKGRLGLVGNWAAI